MSSSHWNLWIYLLQMGAKPVKNVSPLLLFSSESELEAELLCEISAIMILIISC